MQYKENNRKKLILSAAVPDDLTVNGLGGNYDRDFENYKIAYAAVQMALNYAIPLKGFHHASSYSLKHTVEHWVNETHCSEYYSGTKKIISHIHIPNGVFILAAVEMGFKFNRNSIHPENYPNCQFNFNLRRYLPNTLSDEEAEEMNALIRAGKE